jgi:hypothetical protein
MSPAGSKSEEFNPDYRIEYSSIFDICATQTDPADEVIRSLPAGGGGEPEIAGSRPAHRVLADRPSGPSPSGNSVAQQTNGRIPVVTRGPNRGLGLAVTRSPGG